jgi:predicted Zn finger-like uncharacterized protein
MTDQGARCPQCQISFRVSLPQLRAAGGLVRCGFCLTTFDAHAHGVRLAPEPPAQAPPWLREEHTWRIDDGFDRERLTALLGPHPGAATLAEPETEVEPETEPEAETASAPDTARDALAAPWPVATRPPRRRAASAALLVAGGLLLALQALYFHADLLAAHPTAEPIYRALCTLLPCRSAAQQGTASIGVTEVVLRPLPADGLRLDAMLVNASPAPLSLPAVRVEFEDLEGRVVAARTLAPDQYLEAGSPRHLLGRQSLHLVLELRDPGPEAVSYRLVALE